MKQLRLLAIVAALLAVGCRPSTPTPEPSMNTIPLRTICVGRLLIDLPKAGVYRWSQEFDQSTVTRLGPAMSTADLERIAVKKKDELGRSPHATEKHLLTEYKKFDDRRYVILYRTADVDVYTYNIDRYFLIGDHPYKLVSGIATSERQPLADITGVFEKIVSINNYCSDNPPGFCIDGAIVTGDVGRTTASIVIEAVGLKGVALTVGTGEGDAPLTPNDPPPRTAFAILKEEEAIHDDMKGTDERGVHSFDVLLRKERRAGGMEGQVIAYRAKFNNGRFEYRYKWIAQVETGTPPRPHIAIGLDFDDQGPNENSNIPPPPEEQMLGLFNAVLDSVKLRPGGA